MRHRIYPHAQRAIKEIWKYTDRRWGEDQANAYVRGLYQVFENVAMMPSGVRFTSMPEWPERASPTIRL